KNQKASILNSLALGISFGMLFGSKYTAIPYALVLAVFFWREFIFHLKKLNHLVYFSLPFFTLGVSWYLRNLILFQNPFYPLDFLFFKGTNLFSDRVANVTLAYPIEMLNAFIAELRIWSLII